MTRGNYPQPPIDPLDYPICTWCDGGLVVMVETISDCGGFIHQLEDQDQHNYEISCPHCNKTGEEPPIDSLDNPNIP